MINIITHTGNNSIINFNDEYFCGTYMNYSFTDLDKKIIKQIDSAVIIDDDKIQTPFGIASIEDLSTGCKTLININHNPNKIISIVECGDNAIDCLFENFYNGEVTVYANFMIAPSKIVAPCRVDGKIANNIMEYRDAWGYNDED